METGEKRLIPDFFECFFRDKVLTLRYPNATRPWQYVLDLVSGYLMLAEKLVKNKGQYSEAWNFGPYKNEKILSVIEIINYLNLKCQGVKFATENNNELKESKFLRLDSSKSRERLGWKNYYNIEQTLDKTFEWYKAWKNKEDVMNVSIAEIKAYEEVLKKNL